MVIRSAEIADTEKIAATHKASIVAICSACYDPKSIAGWVEILSPDIYKNAIEDKVMILAEEKGELLGLGILDLEQREIGAIYIHPKAKGTGCGKQLLLELESIALKNNVDQLTLCSTINALGFYQYHGYASGNKTLHELPNGIKLECIQMRKTLHKNESV
jgi:putative acetyltransferase